MGWTSPFVLIMVLGGVAILAGFVVIEHHVATRCSSSTCSGPGPYTAGILAGLWAPWAGAASSSC